MIGINGLVNIAGRNAIVAQVGRIVIPQPISGGNITIAGVVNTVVQIIFGMGILISILFLVLAGIRYIVAGDDTKKIEGARRSIVSTIIGLTVIIMTFSIIRLVASMLGANPNSLFDILPSTINLGR